MVACVFVCEWSRVAFVPFFSCVRFQIRQRHVFRNTVASRKPAWYGHSSNCSSGNCEEAVDRNCLRNAENCKLFIGVAIQHHSQLQKLLPHNGNEILIYVGVCVHFPCVLRDVGPCFSRQRPDKLWKTRTSSTSWNLLCDFSGMFRVHVETFDVDDVVRRHDLCERNEHVDWNRLHCQLFSVGGRPRNVHYALCSFSSVWSSFFILRPQLQCAALFLWFCVGLCVGLADAALIHFR